MTNPIPAAPGWYLHEIDEQGESLTPVVAWLPGADTDGEPTLLPYVDGGPCTPPLLMNADDFKAFSRSIVYRPNHDPGAGTESA
ncbi:hypothetical protein LIX60_14920 [Streptomyces sp. S07_1.15]|uniref:hypothetical protein n=1 Tax=Streptomyces sp. S07_1.15 TaxID=2873925 RepID=UPI001D1382DB|nr:hypothetical protein [Streptomyces sp. S07_1.15]MCC3652731.1 hypothetical protein [Streptomyces sp. S07_1.15]